MNIIIVGAGKVGYSIAERLTFEEHNVTLIDTDTEVLAEAQENLDVLTVEGNGVAIDTLRRADAGRGDVLIAMMNADESNLLRPKSWAAAIRWRASAIPNTQSTYRS